MCCWEWTYIMQPAASLTLTEPTGGGPCKYDGAYTAADFVDGISTDESGGTGDSPRPDPIYVTTGTATRSASGRGSRG